MTLRYRSNNPDGTVNFATAGLLRKFEFRAPPAYPIAVSSTTNTATLTQVSSFDSTSGWVKSGSPGAVAFDTTTKVQGTGSFRMDTAASGYSKAQWTIGSNINLANQGYRFWLKCSDWTQVNDFYFQCSTSGTFSTYRRMTNLKGVGDVGTFICVPNGEWMEFVFTAQDFDSGSGGASSNADLATTNIMQISISTTAAISVWFDDMSRFPVMSKGCISLSFDDGFAEVYTVARDIINQAGLKASVNVIPSFIGNAGYLNQSQIDALHGDGWEISGHEDLRLDTMDINVATAKITAAHDYLGGQGYRGRGVFIWPSGRQNAALQAAAQSAGFLAAGGTTTAGQTLGHLSLYNFGRYQLGLNSVDATTTARMDRAKVAGEFLNVVMHRVVKTGTSPTPINEDISEASLRTLVTYLAGMTAVDKLMPSEALARGPV